VANVGLPYVGCWQSGMDCPTLSGEEPRNNAAFACQPQRVVYRLDVSATQRKGFWICALGSQGTQLCCNKRGCAEEDCSDRIARVITPPDTLQHVINSTPCWPTCSRECSESLCTHCAIPKDGEHVFALPICTRVGRSCSRCRRAERNTMEGR